jgi:hypothetical protein
MSQQGAGGIGIHGQGRPVVGGSITKADAVDVVEVAAEPGGRGLSGAVGAQPTDPRRAGARVAAFLAGAFLAGATLAGATFLVVTRLAGALLAGGVVAALGPVRSTGSADSQAMGWLLSAAGVVEVHVLAKPRDVWVGTGTLWLGRAKRAWRASASRRA